MKPNPLIKQRPLIYGIRNTVNGKVYVGKTVCIYRRCHQYLAAYKEPDTKQINDYLLRAFNKLGIENFDMFPLEFCDISALAEREIYWMKFFNSLDRNYGYNLRDDSSTASVVGKSTREKISIRLKQEWASGTRDGHSEKMKKNWENPRRREDQSKLLSKIKTKYLYDITHPDGTQDIASVYSRLCELGIKNCISNFHHSKSNSCSIKGYKITRYSKGET